MEQLSRLPQKLQNAVREYLETREGSKLLAVKSYESTPYKDKSIIDCRHTAYLEWGNLLVTLSFSECTKPEYTDTEVTQSSMIAGDIRVFLEHSWWFKD